MSNSLLNRRKQPAKLALNFAQDEISLLIRESDAEWRSIAAAELGADDFAEQIDALRVEALVRDKDKRPVELWLPQEQILERRYLLLARGEDALKIEAARRIASETSYSAEELTVAVAEAPRGQPSVVLAALLQTVREAKTYAEGWGFNPGTVSTRVAAGRFGAVPARFDLPRTARQRAGGFARRAAIAATVLIGVGAAGYGGYQMMQPYLLPPVDVRSSGPASVSFSVFEDRYERAPSPLSSVRNGGAGNLAIQEISVPLEDPARTLAVSPKSPERANGVPELSQPSPSAAMKVGHAPKLPQHQRPSRLGNVDRNLVGDRRSNSLRDAIDLTRNQGRQEAVLAAGTAIDADADADADTQQTDASVASETELAAPAEDAPLEVAALRPEADPANDVQPDEDVDGPPSSLAPEEMPEPPKPRPAIAEVASSTPREAEVEQTGGAQSDASKEEQVAASTGTDDATQSDEAAQEIAEDTETAAAPAIEAAQNVEVDSSVFAALNAPAPSSRPRTLQKAARLNAERPRALNSISVPTNVRKAAVKHGLALDETSLIGVIDARSGRRALVRMPSGDFRKVARGDVLDGWRVSTINRESLRLTKRGQNRTLLLVSR